MFRLPERRSVSPTPLVGFQRRLSSRHRTDHNRDRWFAAAGPTADLRQTDIVFQQFKRLLKTFYLCSVA